MAETVSIIFTKGLCTNEELTAIHQLLKDGKVDFEPIEVRPTVQASMLDHIIATYNLSPEFWNGVATTYGVEGANKAFVALWRFTKYKLRMLVMSGQKKRFIKKHFIQIPHRIEKNHNQIFLITNKLSEETVAKGMSKLIKASKKFTSKKPVNDHAYREDDIRLKKDGKWKRIKNMSNYLTKMREKHKPEDKPLFD